MKNLEKRFSEDLMITQSTKSVRDPIPNDLLIDIFSRVPAKSIARFRCVSKFWESILGRPYFSELFLTRSVARPQLFFGAFSLAGSRELLLFSSPQPQNPHENSSLVATPYKAFPKHLPTEECTPLYGLVFLQNWVGKVLVIGNPISGEYITLPEVKAKRIRQCHFGFDPINKQFKVLCVTFGKPNAPCVLTLETRKRVWRPLKDPLLPRYSAFTTNEICINGVVYYGARFKTSCEIVCFDFRSERFGLINMDNDMLLDIQNLTLFNYKGHLGAHQDEEEFVLWVLEDAGKHKWSKRKLELSPSGHEIVNKNKFVGMTGTGELVFSSSYLSNPFNIFYYSIERNTFTRFNIQGFEELSKHYYILVETFLDHVENIKFM